MTEQNKPHGSGKRDLHAELAAVAKVAAVATPVPSVGDRRDMNSSSIQEDTTGSPVINPRPK